jgi:hypothetical protein
MEHSFHVVKNLYRTRRVRYRGLANNTTQLYTLFGMANLVLATRRPLELDTLNPCWPRPQSDGRDQKPVGLGQGPAPDMQCARLRWRR